MRQLWLPVDLREDHLTLEPKRLRRLTKVLRMRPGATVTVADGEGWAREYQLTDTGLTGVGAPRDRRSEKIRVHLAAGVLKGERQAWMIQKLTEVGVDRFHPLHLDHCVVNVPVHKRQDRVERWQQVATEAFEQCGRPMRPVVETPTDLAGLLKRLPTSCPVAACDEAGGVPAAQRWLQALPPHTSDVCLVVGPEGGLSSRERGLLHDHVSLGDAVLRAETAAMVAVWTARLVLDDAAGKS